MKALIVAEDEELIEKAGNSLKASGYDLIIYKWLLKALENIEEISPDLILISAVDYPRHWKVLTVYASSILKDTDIFLYINPAAFSEDEERKAELLNIKTCFSSFLDFDKAFAKTDNDIKIENAETIKSVTDCLLESPESNILVTGKLCSSMNENGLSDIIKVKVDFEDIITSEDIGKTVRHITVFTAGKTQTLAAVIKSVGDIIELELV
ncbi:MAG: hypothetical protein K6F69_08380 [Treponema sp.]|nr:hypothetical protein [Treponema sp.]